MKIDRNSLLNKLHERDYLNNLHRRIKESLVGTLRNEYTMQKPMREPYEKYVAEVNQFVSLPIFHAIVDMMTALLLHATAEKFVYEICDAIEEQQ